MPDWLHSITARLVQDALTSLAAYLATQGWLTAGDQEQAFIGSGFFLAMLVINAFLHKARAADNEVKGAQIAATLNKGKSP